MFERLTKKVEKVEEARMTAEVEEKLKVLADRIPEFIDLMIKVMDLSLDKRTMGMLERLEEKMIEDHLRSEENKLVETAGNAASAIRVLVLHRDVGNKDINQSVAAVITKLRRLLPGDVAVTGMEFEPEKDYSGKLKVWSAEERLQVAAQLLETVVLEYSTAQSQEVRRILKPLIDDLSYCIKSMT